MIKSNKLVIQCKMVGEFLQQATIIASGGICIPLIRTWLDQNMKLDPRTADIKEILQQELIDNELDPPIWTDELAKYKTNIFIGIVGLGIVAAGCATKNQLVTGVGCGTIFGAVVDSQIQKAFG